CRWLLIILVMGILSCLDWIDIIVWAQNLTTASQPLYVQRGNVWPEMREALEVLGDRLTKPGKERLVLVGTISRLNNPPAAPVRLVLELPDRLRLEEQQAERMRVVGFDGKEGWATDGALTLSDEDLIETVLYDSAEHFFLGHIKGMATRFLGSRFR